MARIRRLAQTSPGLLEELFTEGERAYAGGRARFAHLAACFAAKEAVLKALGSGLAKDIAPADVEIFHDRGGRPLVRLSGAAATAAEEAGVVSVEVSLTHTGGMAAAAAIALRGDR